MEILEALQLQDFIFNIFSNLKFFDWGDSLEFGDNRYINLFGKMLQSIKHLNFPINILKMVTFSMVI